MGWCSEFGVQIEACDHPMEVAGPDSCHCTACGVVCRGRFEGCPQVWARGPMQVAFTRTPRWNRRADVNRAPDPSRISWSPTATPEPGSMEVVTRTALPTRPADMNGSGVSWSPGPGIQEPVAVSPDGRSSQYAEGLRAVERLEARLSSLEVAMQYMCAAWEDLVRMAQERPRHRGRAISEAFSARDEKHLNQLDPAVALLEAAALLRPAAHALPAAQDGAGAE